MTDKEIEEIIKEVEQTLEQWDGHVCYIYNEIDAIQLKSALEEYYDVEMFDEDGTYFLHATLPNSENKIMLC